MLAERRKRPLSLNAWLPRMRAWWPVLRWFVWPVYGLVPVYLLYQWFWDRPAYRFSIAQLEIGKALRHRELERAETLTHEFLAMAEQRPEHPQYGNAIHTGNQVLGHLCLDRGDLGGAKSYLLRAGRTPGSELLNNFGPRMTLARELVEAGEADVVLEYLEQVDRFWLASEIPPERGWRSYPRMRAWKPALLRQWRAQIGRGEVPEHYLWMPRAPRW